MKSKLFIFSFFVIIVSLTLAAEGETNVSMDTIQAENNVNPVRLQQEYKVGDPINISGYVVSIFSENDNKSDIMLYSSVQMAQCQEPNHTGGTTYGFPDGGVVSVIEIPTNEAATLSTGCYYKFQGTIDKVLVNYPVTSNAFGNDVYGSVIDINGGNLYEDS